MGNTKTLVIGACGQIGTELVMELRKQRGGDNVIAADIREGNDELMSSGPFEIIDVLDKERMLEVVKGYEVEEVYLLAALLSATAEQKPLLGWDLNMNGLLNGLEIAKEGHIKRMFWPSSIAVFGPSTPKNDTPQNTVTEPTTVYGISKLAGERWCEYYHLKYGVDVRSIRYPGLISYKTPPGGGTTDYAVDIFYKAAAGENYTCFLEENTVLPMMYMEDAINATIGIMEAPKENIKIRSSYNVAGISFDPAEIHKSIKKRLPDFDIYYSPDFRQDIANSWPQSIDDQEATKDWGWGSKFDLEKMVDEMLSNLTKIETN